VGKYFFREGQLAHTDDSEGPSIPVAGLHPFLDEKIMAQDLQCRAAGGIQGAIEMASAGRQRQGLIFFPDCG
jgi:hypothetical protein